jgi:tetratricopeptide (TPR) repeat protein
VKTELIQARALFAVVMALSIPISGAAALQGSDYSTAVSLVQQGQFDMAIPLLQQLLGRTPEDLKARNLLGIALSGGGRREAANVEFHKVLLIDPDFVPALKNLAVNELALGLTRDAGRHFEAALKLAPRDPACHWGLAEIAFDARDYPSAAAHYEQSGDLALKDARVAVKFATAYVETKKPARAASILEKLPADIDATTHFRAGLLLARLDLFDAAARQFEAARNGYSDPYQAGFNLMLMQVRKGDQAAAVRTGEELLSGGYRRAELYNLLAQAYEESGKTKEAYDALRTATELEPGDETNYLDLVILCLDQEKYDQGLQIADIGVRRIPSSYRLHLQRGVVLAMNGRYEDAHGEFQIAVQLAPEEGLSQVALGFVLIQMEKFSQAIALLRVQSVKEPNDPYVFWFLGEALNRSGAAVGSALEKEAISALEKSIQLNPRLPQTRTLLGKMLLRRGDVAGASEQLEKALQLDPDDMTATYQLAQVLQRKGDIRARELFLRVEKARSGTTTTVQRDLRRLIKGRRQ